MLVKNPVCDVAGCWQTCVHPHPICTGEGWRAFEIDGEKDGRRYTAKVLACPGHAAAVASNRANLSHFNGGREREPEWAEAVATERGTDD